MQMSEETNTFSTKPWPLLRNVVVDFMNEGMSKHNVHGFGEFDVTHARKLMKDYENEKGEKLSFTSFVLHCIAQAVDENKIMHAIRKKKELILFDDVDVATIVEKDVKGRKFPQNYIIRSANKKTYRQIHEEIRAAQSDLTSPKANKAFMRLLSLPQWMRKFSWNYLRKHPAKKKEIIGTIGVSSIGMFTKEMGWALPITPTTLTFTLGGVYKKAVPRKDKTNEYITEDRLCFTMTVDHDIVDGGPAARFVVRLAEILDKAECLGNL